MPDTEKLDTEIKKPYKHKKANTNANNVEKITHNVRVWENFIVKNIS